MTIQGDQASIIALAWGGRAACTGELCSIKLRGPLSLGSAIANAMARDLLRAFVLVFVFLLVFAISAS